MTDPVSKPGGKDTPPSARAPAKDTAGGRLVLDPGLRVDGQGAAQGAVRLHPDWEVDPPRGGAVPWRIPPDMRKTGGDVGGDDGADADSPDFDAKVAALEELVSRSPDAYEPDGGRLSARFGPVPWSDGPDQADTIEMTEDDLRDLVQSLVQHEVQRLLDDDGAGALAQMIREAVRDALAAREG